MLCIDQLSFSYGTHQVLNNFSLKLPKAQMGTLIGSSGAGKTTLFKLLTGLLSPNQGTFSIGQEIFPKAYQKIAYMTQHDLLLPWRTVWQNLMLMGELGNPEAPMETLRQEARFYLHEFGLDGWENAYPDQLSGGMRQRVSLARVLLLRRPVLLLDEPFVALDVGLREQMHALLRDICKRFETTILMVTHDFRDALSLSDQIFSLSEGKISRTWTITEEMRREPAEFMKIHDEMRLSMKQENVSTKRTPTG